MNIDTIISFFKVFIVSHSMCSCTPVDYESNVSCNVPYADSTRYLGNMPLRAELLPISTT